MNVVEAINEGLTVVDEYVRPDMTGNIFYDPETDSYRGECKVAGRTYELELDEETGKLRIIPRVGDEVEVQLIQHDRAGEVNAAGNAYPHHKAMNTINLDGETVDVAVWEGLTKNGNPMLSLRFSEVRPVRPLRGRFGGFIDTATNDSREATRDKDTELEPDMLSGPGRVDDPFAD